MKTTLFAAMLLASSAGLANAGGQSGTIGAGAEVTLSGFSGPSLNYDAGDFHLGGFLSIDDPAGDDNTDFAIGGRFYYHVHSTAMSDFGVGGAVTFVSDDEPVFGERASLLFIEPGVQFRAFITSNVALSVAAGLPIGLVDADGVALTGQFNGVAGVHYYFF
jgi:hypothetical protein